MKPGRYNADATISKGNYLMGDDRMEPDRYNADATISKGNRAELLAVLFSYR